MNHTHGKKTETKEGCPKREQNLNGQGFGSSYLQRNTLHAPTSKYIFKSSLKR